MKNMKSLILVGLMASGSFLSLGAKDEVQVHPVAQAVRDLKKLNMHEFQSVLACIAK